MECIGMKKGDKLLKEKLITLTLRLPESIIDGIDRDIARRLDDAPGIILHRSDIARDFIVRSLRDRERDAPTRIDTGGGPVLTPQDQRQDHQEDHSTSGEDQS
jgi:hypothetical protein